MGDNTTDFEPAFYTEVDPLVISFDQLFADIFGTPTPSEATDGND
jgi:hypothetical protein